MSTCSIVLADDHAMFRKGVRRIIEAAAGLTVIGEAADGLELLELLKQTQPEIILLDISMPNLRGLEATREIKKLYPKVRIILLTMHRTKEFLQQGLEAGAEGFLLKEDADFELMRAIQTVRQGKKFISPLLSDELAELALHDRPADPLTHREKTIVKLLAEGKSPKEIADLLYISIFTVRRHRDNIMRKLKLKKLADLVRYAIGAGITTDAL
ncbi:MAG: response regulator transcription factor [Deltaproteobacteria bacterium]|nr:response regulator transcription factor [Deltaproteobacteria bacterium]